MYRYDINEVMDEIKEMTIKEKNKFLEKLNIMYPRIESMS